ncbi:hypothetical protein GIB67_014097 [Kingdonia uniflora]|uniref:RDRP C-terminal head domain-containing protein n=1 Tax=Kingdonia uniflora TaxID=39325 RepID=A0A7J7KXI6_9MAGN|nr:hypothetical protein GIB67_014097 [Kingdonia uniflora]
MGKNYSTSSASLPGPAHFSSDQLEHELFQQFITARFHQSNIIDTASDSCLAFMDRLLILGDDCAKEKNCIKEKMLQLSDIYYDALDALKSGKKEIKNEAANGVIQKYKQILYGVVEFEEGPRSREEIFIEALSIYQVNFDYANEVNDVGKCIFAWKIAGRALCALYANARRRYHCLLEIYST